jgi:glucokinase-like ROK family protein
LFDISINNAIIIFMNSTGKYYESTGNQWNLPYAVKNINKHTAIDLIRFTPGGISRVELAHQLGLTRAAITAIIDELQDKKIVFEAKKRHGNGRSPIILEINPNGGKVVGIEMGATHITYILADWSASVLNEIEIPFNIDDGPEIGIKTIDENIHSFLAQSGLTINDIGAVGIGVPGPINLEFGTVNAPPIMAGWDRYPIRDRLKEIWGVPISLNNDAEMGALGEWAYGVGRGETNLVYIKVGTGIGAGLLLDGRIYHGTTGSAGEIGHMTIEEDGPICTCGNYGCLEAIVGGHAIANQAIRAVYRGERTVISSIQPIDSITSRHVLSAAKRGDLIAQRIIIDAGKHLGTAISGVINLINPSTIIIGGGLSQMGDVILEPIRQTIKVRGLKSSLQAVRITQAMLGRRASAMGSVVQALNIVIHQASCK